MNKHLLVLTGLLLSSALMVQHGWAATDHATGNPHLTTGNQHLAQHTTESKRPARRQPGKKRTPTQRTPTQRTGRKALGAISTHRATGLIVAPSSTPKVIPAEPITHPALGLIETPSIHEAIKGDTITPLGGGIAIHVPAPLFGSDPINQSIITTNPTLESIKEDFFEAKENADKNELKACIYGMHEWNSDMITELRKEAQLMPTIQQMELNYPSTANAFFKDIPFIKNELAHFSNLKKLTISNCNNLTASQIKKLDLLPQLIELRFINCNVINVTEHLPAGIQRLIFLGCSNVNLPDELPGGITLLAIDDPSFNTIPACIKKAEFLEDLYLNGTSVPQQMLTNGKGNPINIRWGQPDAIGDMSDTVVSETKASDTALPVHTTPIPTSHVHMKHIKKHRK